MPCACGRIRTSSSSTTTSERRSVVPAGPQEDQDKGTDPEQDQACDQESCASPALPGLGRPQPLVAVRYLDLVEGLKVALHRARGLVPVARVALHRVQDHLLE